MGSMKREGVKGKAENNARVTRQRAVPFEMFCIHLPFVTWRNLGTSGEVEEVGGRAVPPFLLPHRNNFPWAPQTRSSSLLEVWQCTLPPLPTSSGPLGQSESMRTLRAT